MQAGTKQRKTEEGAAVPEFLSRQGIREAEWQYALHSDFRVIMRPGWTWRARILACIIRQSRGYKRDLAVLQVGGDTRKDLPTLLPLFPGGIATILKKVSVDAFQESGINPDEETRKRFKLDRSNLREILESLEVDDGVIVRARCNGEPRKLVDDDLPLDEAVARNRVVLLAALSQKERKRVSNRLLIYLLPRPKPAALKALHRHDDSFPQAGQKAPPPELSGTGIQLIFAFMRKQGLTGDAKYAASLAQLPEVREALTRYEQQTSAAKEQLKAADKFMRDVVARVAAKTPPEGQQPDSARHGDDSQAQLFPPQELVSKPKRAATDEELMPLFNAFVTYCGAQDADMPTVKKMWADCRCSVSDCTLGEVEAQVHAVGRKMAKLRGIDMPAKYLAKGVVTFFDGPGVQAWRAEQAAFDRAERGEACAICSKPVDGAAIQGCHFECYEAAKTRSAS